MSWLYYLLEANLYLLLFYGFYRLFLQNETFYNLNRYFLLVSTLLSFAIPMLQLGLLKPSFGKIHSDYLEYAGSTPPPPMEPPSPANVGVVSTDINWIYICYLFIAFVFALKLSLSIYKIIKLWIKAKKHNAGDVTLIEVNDESTAFSFFNLLFIHPALANQPAVLKHEMVHIKQKHSFDILFFELIQIICWFNPILYFIKKDIKLLHEYIADELTTNTDMQKHEYALFLIQNSFGLRAQPITNQIFNQSILKRRINMLNKKRTASWARLRLLLALPLTGAMLCTSTMAFTKDYGYVDLLPEKSNEAAPIQEKPKVQDIKRQQAPKVENIKKVKTDQIKFPPPIVKKDQIKFPPPIVKPDPPFFKPKDQNHYYVEFRADRKTGKPVRANHMYIVVNGTPYENQDKFYGASNTESVTILNSEEATKKYGNNAKYRAVEITGSDIKFMTDLPEPPPPRADVVRFPPPIVKTEQKYFTPNIKQDKKTGNMIGVDKRYIVVNGSPVEDNSKFLGITKSETIIYLSPTQARKVYGEEKGKYGAVEISGSDIYFNKQGDQLRFPPPIVRPDPPKYRLKKATVPPPPVEPPPPGYKAKKKNIKFPPPVVKPDKVKA